jgi:hypothetical protein
MDRMALLSVTPNTPAEFDVYLCGGNRLSVKVTDQNYNQYVIDYGDGSPVDIVPRGNNAVSTHAISTPPGAKQLRSEVAT